MRTKTAKFSELLNQKLGSEIDLSDIDLPLPRLYWSMFFGCAVKDPNTEHYNNYMRTYFRVAPMDPIKKQVTFGKFQEPLYISYN